jgi:hypothetical protein
MAPNRERRRRQQIEAAMRAQRRAFRKKFGRDPNPDEPVFFDPNADTPQPLSLDVMERITVTAMRKAGVAPQIIYAYKKTGLIVGEETLDAISPERLAEWHAAIDEYFELEDKARLENN